MKTRKYAEETDGYDPESKDVLTIDYFVDVESNAMKQALERVAEATLQSGLRFMKTKRDQEKGREELFLDAEDCTSSVVANLVHDLDDLEHGYEFKGTMQSMDHVVVVYEDETLEKNEDGGEENGQDNE